MSRAAARAAARYGLPETERVHADLQTCELFIDGAPAPGAEEVLAALARTGRPELTVTALARLLTAAGVEAAGEITAALRADPGLRARLLAVLGGSTALGDHLVAHPSQWQLLLPPADPNQLIPVETIRAVLADAVGVDPAAPRCSGTAGARATVSGGTAVATLRAAYRSQLLVIAAHDLAPAVDPDLPVPGLSAVCRTLSELADATLQTALSVAAAALPDSATPVRLSVVAMGKCGARELNYLSDVDVIFIADHPTADHLSTDHPTADEIGSGRPASDSAMLATATTLAAQLMRICGQVAWEVDAGLRPEGGAGPLVRTPASHAAYYQRWAHTWEFQALLKARPAAGDVALGEQFLGITQPGVWSAAARESFVDDVQAMRRRVEDNIPDAHRDRELKLGSGGLRDVEFAVQLLQLVHGRTDEELRHRGTLIALDALIRGGYIGRADGAEMAAAYTFLRRTEHRLQLQRLRRTHLLPEDPADLEWLARTEGHTATGTASAAEQFSAERQRHAATVRRLHEKLFYRPLLHAVAAVAGDELRLSPQAAAARLAALGFATPEGALRHIAALTSGISRRAAIQRTLLPVLLDTFATCPDPDAGLLAYRKVSEALASTPWYLRLLRDEGSVAQRLAALLGGSKLVADLLTRAPEVLRLLGDETALTASDPATVASALLARSRRASTPEDAVDSARSARRHELLRLACGDLLGMLDVHAVAGGLSSIAAATVQAGYEAAVRRFESERGTFPARMAIIGMGRIGGAELGYGSDADVMFVAEPVDGADPADAMAAATAVADQLTRLLGRTSPDPPLEVDAGLRPEGRNGRLVRTLDSYASYWERFAEPWERQALLRARPIAGDSELGEAFVAAAAPVRYPEGGLPASAVVEIRRIKARVDTERLPRGADPHTHTKLGLGGLSDIEWTVQLLQLRHAHRVEELRTPSTLSAIAAARAAGLLEAEDAADLRAGWISATRTRNAIMLVRGKADDQIPRQGRPLVAVARALGYPEGSDPGEFIDDYRRAARRARRVVDRVFDLG